MCKDVFTVGLHNVRFLFVASYKVLYNFFLPAKMMTLSDNCPLKECTFLNKRLGRPSLLGDDFDYCVD